MAKPQLEDGHTKIANGIVEALARVNLTGHESRVLWCILRKTYGWNKKSDRISYTQFQELTGIDRRHVGRAISSLKTRQIIFCRGEGYALEYGLQKDYELWDIATISGNDFDTKQGNDLPPFEATKLKEHPENLPPSGDNLPPSQGESPPFEATNLPPFEATTKDRKHITKDNNKRQKTTAPFEDFRESLRERFKDLDFDGELEKFHLYWYEGRRKPPANKKLALLNWMQKARQISAESDALAKARVASARGNERLVGGNHDRVQTVRGIPGNQPAGAFDDLEV